LAWNSVFEVKQIWTQTEGKFAYQRKMEETIKPVLICTSFRSFSSLFKYFSFPFSFSGILFFYLTLKLAYRRIKNSNSKRLEIKIDVSGGKNMYMT